MSELAVVVVQEGDGKTDGGTPPPEPNFLTQMLPFFLMVFAIFYFLLIRPQRRQAKEREAMLSALKKNDRILTQGGIFGTIMAVGDTEVTLKIDDSNNTRVKLARSAIVAVVNPSAEEGARKDSEPSAKKP